MNNNIIDAQNMNTADKPLKPNGEEFKHFSELEISKMSPKEILDAFEMLQLERDAESAIVHILKKELTQ